MARSHWSYYLRNAFWPFAMRPLPDLASFGGDGPPTDHLAHGMRHTFTVTNSQ